MKTKDELLKLVASIEESSTERKKKAKIILDSKMKPLGSLGKLEEICIKFAGVYDIPIRKLNKKCHIVVAADNGIIEEGVSSCPLEYTSLVVEAMLNKIAAIGIFSQVLNIDFFAVDVGMKTSLKREYPNFYERKINYGTKNFAKEKAMSLDECLKCINLGIELITKVHKDYDIFSNGEMGIGNTSTSSAILYSILGDSTKIDNIVGRGGGISNESFQKKKEVIIDSCKKYDTFNMDVIDILATVGGFDIACMVGMYIGAGLSKKVMLVDGFISAVAALVAYKLNPNIKDYLLFTHMSEEPGMKLIVETMQEETFLNMKMRLGEGTGSVFAYPIIECAIEMMNTMKTPKEVYDLFF